MIPTTGVNENEPSGSDQIALGDNAIRRYKVQNREILEVDHVYPTTGQDDDAGKHKKVTLVEQADIGIGAEGYTALGGQTVSGKPELVYTDEDDNDVQITSGGKIKLSSGRLENNANLTARNQADGADINLLKANTSDQAEVTPALLPAGGVILPEITAPTTVANQGALYTKNDGDQTELYFREESNGDEVQITDGGTVKLPPGFGSWVDKSSSYAAQQAATDGFVVCCANNVSSTASTISGYTDSGASPSTLRCNYAIDGDSNPRYGSFTMPVKKSDYWKVTASSLTGVTLSVSWIPLGS